MKTLLALLLSALCAVYGQMNAQTDTVTILHVNDSHSNLAPIGPRTAALKGKLGGIARVATMVGTVRASDPGALFLHAGDFSIGDMFYNKYFGVAELRLLAMMGLDVMTVGNHEFDLMPSTFLTALDSGFVAGGFPLLSANLIAADPTVERLNSYITPFTVKTVGGVKVGIFGLTTPSTNLLSQPSPAVLDTNVLPIAAAMVDSLKARQCDLVICLSHLGVFYDKVLAASVPGIHAIIGGHDHFVYRQPIAVQNPAGDTTWVVQAEAFYLNVGKMRFTVTGGVPRLLDYVLMPVDSTVEQEPTIAGAVAGMIADIESVYGPLFTQQIGTSTGFFEEMADSLTIIGWHDTPVGNLVADAFRATTGTQIAIEPGGSTAEPFYPGPLVGDDAFRVVGYGFNTVNGLGYRLVTFSIKGAALLAGMEYGLSEIELGDDFLIQVSGMTYKYNPTLPPFSRLISVKVGDNDIDPAASYSVTGNEFVLMFLSTMGIPVDNPHVFSDTTEFQALAGYIAQAGSITPYTDGRIEAKNPESTGELGGEQPKGYYLNQNFPNPLNPSTTIEFGIPKAAEMSLVVYNVLGQEVATLAHGWYQAGRHSVRWDANGAASGSYFLRLVTPSGVITNKMLLLK